MLPRLVSSHVSSVLGGSYCILDPAAVFGHVNKHVRYFNVEKYCEAALNRENNTKRSWGATMEQSGARYL